MTTETLDCVKLKRDGARKLRDKTADLTLEEELAFWHGRSEALRRRQQAAARGEQPPASERTTVD